MTPAAAATAATAQPTTLQRPTIPGMKPGLKLPRKPTLGAGVKLPPKPTLGPGLKLPPKKTVVTPAAKPASPLEPVADLSPIQPGE